MNGDQNEPKKPRNADEPLPRVFWLFAAFSPVLILLMAVGDFNQPVNRGLFFNVVLYVINPVISIVSSYHLGWNPNSKKSLNIVGAILLGGAIAVLNPFIALFAACAMNPPRI